MTDAQSFCMILFMVLAGCTDTDTPLEVDPMQGTWNLLNISGGFVGMDQDFEKGTVVWSFPWAATSDSGQ